MGEAQGKKVSPTPLRLRRSRCSRPLARSARKRPWVRAETASSGEDVADPEGPAQDIRPSRRRERKHGVERGWYRHQRLAGPTVIVQGLYCLQHRFEGLGQNTPTTVAIVSRSSSTSRASTRLSSPTCSIKDDEAITLRSRVTARRRLTDRRRPLERAAPPPAAQSPCA
jgi:hypothetical protein